QFYRQSINNSSFLSDTSQTLRKVMFNYQGSILPHGGSITTAPGQFSNLPSSQQAAAANLAEISVGDAVASWSAMQIAQLLSSRPSDAVNERGWNGLTPLHRACLRGQADIVDCLLAKGADSGAASDNGETPMHCAARRGNPQVLESLLRSGVDPFPSDRLGKLPVHHAASNGSVFSLLYLEQCLSGQKSQTPLFETQDYAGRTPLHYAVQHDHDQAIEALLRQRRCCPLIADQSGDTPLHLAARLGRAHHCYLLLLGEPGSNWAQKLLFATNKAGRTALDETAVAAASASSARTSTTAIALTETVDPHRLEATRSFLNAMRLAGTPARMRLLLRSLWLLILIAPFSIFGIAVLLSQCCLPSVYAPYLLTCGTVCSVLFTRSQGHRMDTAAKQPNPAYFGSFFGGFAHTMICYFAKCVWRHDIQYDASATWLHYSALLCLPLFCIIYAALLRGDPGWATASNETTLLRPDGRPTTLVDLVRERRALADSYCSTCERCLSTERTKHCRLCNRCVLDLDHHCLFLMKCVAKNNLRLFACFMLLAWYGVTAFLVSSFRLYSHLYGPLPAVTDDGFFGAHASNLASWYFQEPWLFHSVLLNAGSWVFGAYMNYYNLTNLSMGQTYFFRIQRQVGLLGRIKNLYHFFTTGRVFASDDFAVPYSRATDLL
ncbi:hypothetical protein BOX15_Mlig031299g5, partial [Macrostomum lignano]